jgi:enoyl-[acyl-carrier protein] reductase I
MAQELLAGKKGIIFGALDERSIAWKTAQAVVAQGAEIVLTNAPVALRMGKINELAAQCNAQVIPADATSTTDIENLIAKSMEIFGGKFDFMLHSIGMSPNVRKNIEYTQTNYEFFLKTVDISALSLHRILQVAMKLDALNDWGSVLALSYIAAQRTFPGYNDMADVKALLESIARKLGRGLPKQAHVVGHFLNSWNRNRH